MPAEPAPADEPQHPVSALTTYELQHQRRELERAIAFFSKQDPVPPACGDLRVKLDAVVSEQQDRDRIRRANA